MVPFLLNPGWNIPKKIPKKYKIIKKKCHSGSNSSQTELRQVEEEKKFFRSGYRFYLTRAGAFLRKFKNSSKKKTKTTVLDVFEFFLTNCFEFFLGMLHLGLGRNSTQNENFFFFSFWACPARFG